MIERLQSRKDYEKVLFSLLSPLKERFSPEKARIRLYGAGATYKQDAVEMEAFARPLWGLVPYWMGGGRESGFEEIYSRGLAAGTDPSSAEYWGDTKDFDQRFVEMAPIAFGIFAVPEVLWYPLSIEERERAAAWLYTINDHTMSRCNWYYFRILVNLALRKHGMRYSKEQLESDFEYMESCYIGNGWYKDGVSGRTDYYSAFAMQYYAILTAWMLSEEAPEYAALIKSRAREFSKSFILWFDAEGRGLPYGRSLTYRMAQSSFWAASLFLGVDAFDKSIVKGLINRNLRYWMCEDIADSDGILSVGYCYPNLTMAERYNAPGSPYWACKAFLFLALSESDSFWREDEAMYPEKMEGVKAITEAKMLLQQRLWDLSAYVPGMNPEMKSLGHFSEKYDKFVYSTAFPFSVSHSSESFMEAAPDNMLSFEIAGHIFVRRGCLDYSISESSVVSKWSPYPGIEVRTTIEPIEDGHLRVHEIDSSVPFTAYDSGPALPADDSSVDTSVSGREAVIKAGKYIAVAEDLTDFGEPSIAVADPNTSLGWRHSVIPFIKYSCGAGRTRIETKFTTQRRSSDED